MRTQVDLERYRRNWEALDRRYQELLARRHLGYVQLRSAVDATEWNRAEQLREELLVDLRTASRRFASGGSGSHLEERKIGEFRELLAAIRRRYEHTRRNRNARSGEASSAS